jgi:MFS family permease
MHLPPALRALHSRNYRLFVSGQLVSLIGTWMQSVAQSWLIYRLTGSAALLGLIGFAGQIPIFVIAPFGGVVADRLNRHRVLIATQSSMMALAAALASSANGRSSCWRRSSASPTPSTFQPGRHSSLKLSAAMTSSTPWP